VEYYPSEKPKLLVVRPLGGLNDVLCQIEYARKLAVKTQRRLAIQTETGNKDLAHKFGQHFSSIFEFVDGTSSPSQSELRNLLLTSGDIFPEHYGTPERLLEGSLEEISNGTNSRYQLEPGGHDSFDVIVHESWGGGILGAKLLKRIALTEEFFLRIQGALMDLPSKSTGIHFRNTDYKSELEVLNNLVRRANKNSPIVLASDDDSIKELLMVENPSRQIFSVADFIRSDTTLTKTEIAVAQLFVLAMCHNFVMVPLAKGQPVQFSGYSQLAKAIWCVRKLTTEGVVGFVLSRSRFFGSGIRPNPRGLLQSLSMNGLILSQSLNPQGLYRQIANVFRRE